MMGGHTANHDFRQPLPAGVPRNGFDCRIFGPTMGALWLLGLRRRWWRIEN
jgi:hypothetical protein